MPTTSCSPIDGCYLGNWGQLGIRGLVLDHCGRVLRAFSKLVDWSLAIEARNSIGQSFEFLNFMVEGDSTIIIPWLTKKERQRWKSDGSIYFLLEPPLQ